MEAKAILDAGAFFRIHPGLGGVCVIPGPQRQARDLGATILCV